MEHIKDVEIDLTKQSWKKNTALFLTSQTISLFGSSLVQYAISWYITLETQSGLMITLSILFGFLPTLLLSPFAGVWADRYDRKKLILLADGAIALTTLVLAVMYMAGHRALWLIFIASAIRALGTAVQMPAVGAFLPQIVPEHKLMRVNGINGSIQSAIMLLSPMISGALMAFASIQSILIIDVVTAAIGMSILGFALHPPERAVQPSVQDKDYFQDLKAGFVYIRTHNFLKVFFEYYAVLLFLVAPAAFLTPLQVIRSFGEDVWRLTVIEVCFSMGMLGGGALLSVWGGFKNRVRTIAAGMFLMGATTLGLGVVPWFFAYMVLMSVCGIGLALFNIPSNVMLQETVEDAYMGRVFGVMTMISSSAMPMGILIFGPVADWVSIEILLMGSGLMIMMMCITMVRSAWTETHSGE